MELRWADRQDPNARAGMRPAGFCPPTSATLQGDRSELDPSAAITDPSLGRGPVDRWFHDRYGGKKAFLRSVQHGMRRMVGAYGRERTIDAGSVRRLVFVCVGNICRSPYGEFVARDRGLATASFGLRGRTGDPANPNALAVAGERGIDLATHRATAWEDYEPLPGDLMLGSEPDHTQQLRTRYAGQEQLQVALLGLFARPAVAYLHDPYGLGPTYFRRCYERIESAVDGLASDLRAAGAPVCAGEEVG